MHSTMKNFDDPYVKFTFFVDYASEGPNTVVALLRVQS